MATCFGCHQHENQWAVRDCDGCHVDLQAENTLPSSHLVHEGDWLREHGVRAASARDLCASCHSERSCAVVSRRQRPGFPARLAFDEARLSGLASSWFPIRHAEEARAADRALHHLPLRAFVQRLSHRFRCRTGTAGRSPHPAGLDHHLARWRTARVAGTNRSCLVRLCHGGAGEQLCVGCHRVGGPGGNPHGPGFSSAKTRCVISLPALSRRSCDEPGSERRAFGQPPWSSRDRRRSLR